MEKKDDKMTGASSMTPQELQESLAPLGDVRLRKMFGGYGVFEGETMFALVDSQGVIFFKADETNLTFYQEADAAKHGRMPYYQVPDNVLEDVESLREWAQSSITVAQNAKRSKK